MHGISPINHSLTLRQSQMSAVISESVSAIPTTVSDLISQMAEPDYSLAKQPMQLDEAGEIITTPKNLEIAATIELALTASSSDCSPLIKADIFWNASNEYRPSVCKISYLAHIINRIRDSGQQINLDDVALIHLDMTKTGVTDLSDMSAQRAMFTNVNMPNLKMHRANLTGAIFTNSIVREKYLESATLTDVMFSNVEFSRTPIFQF